MLNSLLALLNSRDSIRDKNGSEPLSIRLSNFATASVRTMPDEPPRHSGLGSRSQHTYTNDRKSDVGGHPSLHRPSTNASPSGILVRDRDHDGQGRDSIASMRGLG